jgi:hypothetical protein
MVGVRKKIRRFQLERTYLRDMTGSRTTERAFWVDARIWFLPPQFSEWNSSPISFPTLLLGVSVTHAIINQEDAISAILPHRERHQEALL